MCPFRPDISPSDLNSALSIWFSLSQAWNLPSQAWNLPFKPVSSAPGLKSALPGFKSALSGLKSALSRHKSGFSTINSALIPNICSQTSSLPSNLEPDRWMDKQTKVPCVLQDFVPFGTTGLLVSLLSTIIQSRAKGIADYILLLGDWLGMCVGGGGAWGVDGGMRPTHQRWYCNPALLVSCVYATL